MKVFLVAGTRPEVIKTAGLVFAARAATDIDLVYCSSGQHRSMLDETLADFGLAADLDLEVMGASGLHGLSSRIVERFAPVLEDHRPDVVLVQGDTATAFSAALSAYYMKIPVGHVEAGLRTNNFYSPWPEEGNRRLIGSIASFHFPPTELARANLLCENIPDDTIMVTGNTVIDALLHASARMAEGTAERAALDREFSWINSSKRLILVTGHRRENFGEGFRNICLSLSRLAQRDDIEIVYPVHLNPDVRRPVHDMLADAPSVHLIEPLRYRAFVYLMMRCALILTDSGGVQEEAPSLGKPVLVMRDTSERMEAVEAGSAKLVGTDSARIVAEAEILLDDVNAYAVMASVKNPFGDGTASTKILDWLKSRIG